MQVVFIDFNSCDICLLFFFFFNDTATTEIYTLSLHDNLPIATPIPWQQFVESLNGMLGNTRQNVREPGLWIDVVHLGCGDQYITAARSPPRSEPQNKHDLRAKALPRTPRS